MKRNNFLTDRARRAASLLDENNIDALFVSNLTNVSYLSGFSGSTAYLLITPRKGIFFTDFRYEEASKNEIFDYHIEVCKDSFTKILSKFIKGHKIKRLGFESASLPHSQFNELKKELRGLKLIPTKNLIENMRSVKDALEINLIRNSAAIIDDVLKYTVPLIKEGVTEKDVTAEIEFKIRKHGADKSAFDTIVAFGSNAASPHAKPGMRKAKNGDIIMIDLGCTSGGYSSDLTRTFFLNTINSKQKKIYEIVLLAQQGAISAIKPGQAASEVDREARKIIHERGFGSRFGHALGHGIGKEVHEQPSISSKSKDILSKGMVFTVEPGIYLSGWGGIRIEDIACVTDSGCEILTKSPKGIEKAVI